MKKRGTTLVEIMVAVVILGIIMVPLYYLLKDASNKRALVASRDYVKQEANKVLKLLESDLSQARKGSFKQVSDDVIEIKVRKPGKDDTKDVALSYLYVAPELVRRFEGQRWLVSKNVENFAVSTTPEVGRLVVSLKMKAALDGIAEEQGPEYAQEKLIVMKEDSSEELDAFWRDVGDVNKFFATQGSVMGGIKDDAKQLTQQFTSEWSAAGADISNMTVGEITKVKNELMNGLKDVKKSLDGLDKDILGLSADALFDRNWLGGMSDSKKEKAKKVRETLAGMKTKGEMDWNKLKNIGGTGGLFTSGMKTDAIKQMFNAKAELFNSGQQIVKQLDDFKKQTQEVGGIDLSEINRSTWGM
ncbi:MAG: prepilin-type N-terminal cleavage/methylation domain-containing protein [Candidatus Riflebacteria bacterium]|nr:prepilin-type N-terminal cleavage/methylation domain-containing protein [Candidatus Riflebacteria bacterium]